MNEKLEEVLADMLEKAMNLAETSGEWALDKAPELIQQFLMWEMWSSVVGAVVGFILLVIGVKSMVSLKRDLELPLGDRKYSKRGSSSADPTFLGVVTGVVGLVLLLVGTAVFFGDLYTVIHILVAPDVYLIKEILGSNG